MKTITINIYSPKELWTRMLNWLFWPRRKKCAEWIEVLQVGLTHSIINEIIIPRYDQGIMGSSLAEDLEISIREAIDEKCQILKELMSKPF